jgi:hypothetical protein
VYIVVRISVIFLNMAGSDGFLQVVEDAVLIHNNGSWQHRALALLK